jgi:hypothetical protein
VIILISDSLLNNPMTLDHPAIHFKNYLYAAELQANDNIQWA